MAMIKKPVNGMKDILPGEMAVRTYVTELIRRTYSAFGFSSIDTPVVEHIENLLSKQGGENEKLIFKVLKRGEKLDLTKPTTEDAVTDSGLRYDLTLPLSRYYANHANELPSPFKALQIGSVFRADRPQRGRYRQFTQCDIDILGDGSSLAEIELITATAAMLSEIFAEINVKNFTVHVNDRRILSAVALSAGFAEEEIGNVLISLDKFDKIGLDGIEKEMLENGYDADVVGKYLGIYRAVTEGISIEEFCQDISRDVLEEKVIANLSEIISCVRPMLAEGVKIVFDPTLVRGMGYYTGPIFEITMDGYNFSIAGGGRYDKMIGKFSGQDVAASGFSIGFERIVTILKDHMESGYKLEGEPTAFLIGKKVSLERKAEVLAAARELRAQGATVTVLPMAKNVGHQIELLENEGFAKFEKIFE